MKKPIRNRAKLVLQTETLNQLTIEELAQAAGGAPLEGRNTHSCMGPCGQTYTCLCQIKP